jgi:hypothetical protein
MEWLMYRLEGQELVLLTLSFGEGVLNRAAKNQIGPSDPPRHEQSSSCSVIGLRPQS